MSKQSQEEFHLKGEDVIKKVKELIHQGNIRSLLIKDNKGKVLVQFPLTVGVIGVALAPIFAAIGAIAALTTECTIVVERKDS